MHIGTPHTEWNVVKIYIYQPLYLFSYKTQDLLPLKQAKIKALQAKKLFWQAETNLP